MQAKICEGYITLSAKYHHENLTIAEVYCADYEHFKALPAAIEVEGVVCGKMSWNSDKFYACYKNSALIGKVLP